MSHKHAPGGNREPSVMPGAELRTYVLGAVVSVLIGVCIGFGWHYFADSAGATTTSSAVTPLAKPDTSTPALSCPPGPREDPGLDIPRLQSYPASTATLTGPMQRAG